MTGIDITQDDAQRLVAPFYRRALTVNRETSPTAVLEEILAPDFQSLSAQGSKSRDVLAAQIEGFWKLIPDLRWEPQELLLSGNKAVVRSVASGTPRGPFFGVETDGTRSFRIDTIDIHEVIDGRIARVHHVEDWASALKQLRG